MKYIMDLKKGIEDAIVSYHAFVIGEDIQEPYGGAFKVTKGLSDLYPDHIIATPMCESGFFGMGVGMAVEGSCVIVESMFGDFITLTADQMINHAAKFYQMYKEPMRLVLRCPSGGYRGYGATHSQSLEKIYFGIPGMQVIAPSIAHSPGALLKKSLLSGVPTLFVENKLDYARELLTESGAFWEKEIFGEEFPAVRISVKNETPDYTIVTYGGLVSIAFEVMQYFLYEEETYIDLIIPSNLFDMDVLSGCVRSREVLVAEEGVKEFGWGAEAACRLYQDNKKVQRLGAKKSFIPASQKWESKVLPQKEEMIRMIREGRDNGI